MKKADFLLLLFLIIFAGCSNSIYKKSNNSFSDGKYDNGFPEEDCSQQLEEITKSIEKIHSYIEYNVYRFTYKHHLTDSNLPVKSSYDNLKPDHSFVESEFGTATRIYTDNNYQILLTCAHVLDYTDTIYTYFNELDANGEKVIIASRYPSS